MRVTPLRWRLPWFGEDRLLLAEIELELALAGIAAESVLLRASEQRELHRILTHGTDRGGYPGNKPWRHNAGHGCALLHEDVVLATTVFENRVRQSLSSLSKIAGIEDPLVLVYDDRGSLRRLRDNHWTFRQLDEKLEALRCIAHIETYPAIEGWFSADKGMAYRALVAAIERQPARVVEVGSWCGRSTSFIARLCQRRGIRLSCVDAWEGSADEHAPDYRRQLAARDIPAAFAETMRRLEASPEVLAMPSSAAAATFEDGTVDLVFIDASHDLASVQADLNAWLPKLVPGGSLAGDDYCPEFPGVCTGVDALARDLGCPVEHPATGLWRLVVPPMPTAT